MAETFAGRLTAFTIAADGALTDRRVWGQIAPTVEPGPVRGDAPAPGLRARRLLHGRRGPHLGRGRARRADVPDRAGRRDRRGDRSCPTACGAFACMLGGEDGRTLLLCSAPDFIEANRKDVREAVLLTTTVDVPHGGRP